MFLEICMQIHYLVFASSRQINKKKPAKTINLLCAGNKVFVKYQAQEGVFNTNPAPLAYALGSGPAICPCLLCSTPSIERVLQLQWTLKSTIQFFNSLSYCGQRSFEASRAHTFLKAQRKSTRAHRFARCNVLQTTTSVVAQRCLSMESSLTAKIFNRKSIYFPCYLGIISSYSKRVCFKLEETLPQSLPITTLYIP